MFLSLQGPRRAPAGTGSSSSSRTTVEDVLYPIPSGSTAVRNRKGQPRPASASAGAPCPASWSHFPTIPRRSTSTIAAGRLDRPPYNTKHTNTHASSPPPPPCRSSPSILYPPSESVYGRSVQPHEYFFLARAHSHEQAWEREEGEGAGHRAGRWRQRSSQQDRKHDNDEDDGEVARTRVTPQSRHHTSLLPKGERGTFLVRRLFAEVLVHGATHHTNPLLQKILCASAPTAGVGEGQGTTEKVNPLVLAVRSVLVGHGLQTVSGKLFKPLMEAAFALLEARQARGQGPGKRDDHPGNWECVSRDGDDDGGGRRSTVASAVTARSTPPSSSPLAAAVEENPSAATALAVPTNEEVGQAIAGGSGVGSKEQPAQSPLTVRRVGKLDDTDYHYLYRYLDWEGYQCIDAGIFLSRLRLVTRPLCVVRSAVLVHLLFLSHTQQGGATGRGQGNAMLSWPPAAGSSWDIDEETAACRPRTDLYEYRHKRLSLVHQQQLISLLELQTMLDSVLEAFLVLREEALQSERREQEERQAAAAATRARTRSRCSMNAATVALGTVFPTNRDRTSTHTKRRRRDGERCTAAVDEAQRREDARGTVATLLRPSCHTILARCAAVHDGAFRVTVGQVREAIFAAPEMVSVLGEIADLYLPPSPPSPR